MRGILLVESRHLYISLLVRSFMFQPSSTGVILICDVSSFVISFLIGYGRRDVVEFLLSAGAQIQARDDGGLHPIHNACSFGHADVVRLLLEAGANPNVRDNWNFTPLHEAALKGKAEVCIGKRGFNRLLWFQTSLLHH